MEGYSTLSRTLLFNHEHARVLMLKGLLLRPLRPIEALSLSRVLGSRIQAWAEGRGSLAAQKSCWGVRFVEISGPGEFTEPLLTVGRGAMGSGS